MCHLLGEPTLAEADPSGGTASSGGADGHWWRRPGRAGKAESDGEEVARQVRLPAKALRSLLRHGHRPTSTAPTSLQSVRHHDDGRKEADRRGRRRCSRRVSNDRSRLQSRATRRPRRAEPSENGTVSDNPYNQTRPTRPWPDDVRVLGEVR